MGGWRCGKGLGQFDQSWHRPSSRCGGRGRECRLPHGAEGAMAATDDDNANARPGGAFPVGPKADESEGTGPSFRIRAFEFFWIWRRERVTPFPPVPMSAVFISGCGAVSPAGWDLAAMRDALAKGQLFPC